MTYQSTLPTGFIKDGYRDLIKRMETQNNTGYNYKKLMSALPQLLASIFDSSSLGKDVITIPINDAFKEGRRIKSLDDKEEKVFNKAYIEYDNKIKQGLIFAGVFGGAYLVINSKSQSLEDELEIRKDDIENIAVLDPTQLTPFEISGNPLSKKYMKPTYYTSLYGETIHPSRVIFIDGDVCTNATRELNQGLGLSRYERIHSELKKLDTASEMVLDITSMLSQDVISIDGLNEVLADQSGKGTELIHERLNIINSIKSIMSTLAIDGKDSYTNVNRSLAGTDKVLQFLQMMVAGASRIPMTKLFGKSADGQNATGKGDLDNYYDDVWSNIIIGRIAPIYSILDPIVVKDLFDSDEVVEYEFIPLYTLNEIEIADIGKTNAETNAILIEAGVVSENDVLKEYQKKGEFVDIEVGDEYEEDGNGD